MNTLSSKWNILQMPIDYAFCPEKNNKLKNERDIDFNTTFTMVICWILILRIVTL